MWWCLTRFSAKRDVRPIELGVTCGLFEFLEHITPLWTCHDDMWVLEHPYSMARGTYSGRYATSTALVSVWWVVLDCDQGLRDFLLERLEPFLYVAWTTKRHTPALPRFRVAIPLHSPVTVAQHDALLASLMAGYGKHDDLVHQAAILPVIWFSKGVERHTRRPFRFWGHVGRLLSVDDLPSIPAAAAVAAVVAKPIPANNTRLSAALKANVVPACRMVGVELPASFSLRQGGDTHVKLSCPLGDHEDRHPSAQLTVFHQGDKDLAFRCFSHPVALPAVPIGALYWWQRFKPERVKSVSSTNPQVPVYAARLLLDGRICEIDSPWTLPVEELVQWAVGQGVELVEAEPGRSRMLRFVHRDEALQVTVEFFRKAYEGTNLIFACKHLIHVTFQYLGLAVHVGVVPNGS